MSERLTHLNEKGEAHMVDVGDKAATKRRAVARSTLSTRPDVADALFAGAIAKGDALATARIAGIMGAKKTADLIPLCHPLPLSSVTIDIDAGDAPGVVAITASVETTGPTGVEMEALTAASVAALTLYDMGKAMDKAMTIAHTQLVSKSGGKSGDFERSR